MDEADKLFGYPIEYVDMGIPNLDGISSYLSLSQFAYTWAMLQDAARAELLSYAKLGLINGVIPLPKQSVADIRRIRYNRHYDDHAAFLARVKGKRSKRNG